MFLETVQINALGNLLAPFLPHQRIYGLYLLSAIILAFVAYHQINHDHDEDESKSEKPTGFLPYIFDSSVFMTAATWQDVKYFAANAIIYYGVAAQFLIGMHEFSNLFHTGLVATLGTTSAPLISNEISLIAYTLLSVILIDLGVYIAHLAHHKIPFLWEFHKVHHSAEKLTPITLFRMHPVDLAITTFVTSLLVAIAFAGLFYMTGEKPQALTLFGLNIITFAFYLSGYNLRHSHIWLDYPKWLGKILISPAQHQIHHSSDPKHFDKNMGLIFAFWDRLLGTHYLPKGREQLTYGLSRKEPNPFKSIAEMYIKPFIWAGGHVTSKFSKPSHIAIASLSGLAIIIGYVSLSQHAKQAAALADIPDIELKKLTWTETHKALERGYDTVLIPTAGVEQNGPHVILGKHELIVSFTANHIAKKLGKTLVAPVINYVPEGATGDNPTGHMAFSGTLSVPEAVFEQVLTATAKSLKTHGFKNILFIGDSGGNQQAQQKVAQSLEAQWRQEDITVAHIGDYYTQNGQMDYLLSQGYSKQEIGYHAGMRDTSELLYVAPSAVRQHITPAPINMESGYSGAPSKADADIGRIMIEKKIAAAVKQIRPILEKKRQPEPERLAQR